MSPPAAIVPPRHAPLALALLLCLGCSGGEASDVESVSPGPVVLVVADPLPAEAPGADGVGAPAAPFLDRLVREGTVFERAHASSPLTAQSLASLVTGRLPSSGGAVGLRAQPAEGVPTLAELFAGAGYATGLVSGEPLLARRGFSRGFEDIQVAPHPGSRSAGGWSGGELAARALDFIDLAADEPFFLHLHHPDPPPAETRAPSEGQGSTGDGAGIASVDDTLRRLADGLRDRGLLADTLLIVTSPTGTGRAGPAGPAAALHQELLRVPLLFHGPGVPRGTTVDSPVSLIDLLPTLRHLRDLPEGRGRPDGRRLFERAADGGIRPLVGAEPIIAELVLPGRTILRSVARGGWKYVHDLGPGGGSAGDPQIWGDPLTEGLYHLGRDPRERTPVEDEAVMADLRAILERYAARCRADGARLRLPGALDAAAASRIEEIETLGYL